ncbi:MAG: hypothetical protein ACOH12_14155 [Parvibaculaceae bacterium]
MAEDSVDATHMETPPVPRMLGLKVAVAVMGFVLVAGIVLVLTTIILRVTGSGSADRFAGAAGRFGITDVSVDKGDVVRSVTLTEDRAAVHVTGAGGDEIIILNVKTGTELGRFRLHPVTGLADASGR